MSAARGRSSAPRGAASGGGRTKSGKPRPGTGGYGKRKLEGKGPTPPAEQRPGHPAQRRAAAQAKRGSAAGTASGADGPASRADGRSGTRAGSQAGAPDRGSRARGAGSAAAELVAGRNPVLEALQARVPATALHVGPRLDDDERIGQAVMLAANLGIPVVEAGRSELDRLTGGAIHQGIALRIRRYAYADPDDLVQAARDLRVPPLIVALDGVTDPRNLGAVARSVAAFGGHGILVPSRRSAGVTAGAWKASAGTLARVRVAQTANLTRALTSYQEDGLFVAGLDAQGSEDVGQLELADSPLVLVVGSEGKGLSRLVAERCDVLARIPITGPAESLNAGIAASIALYAVSRLRESG
ncbi:MAG TPA: 23S rRNA (guanosine(2251)-2'-O)-methyltransferase RlmB [Streptosporangiaceae bacterium]|nr:23S rRNA (guanosine(2251)-2'-O)-methyltransferase RlmB [Streptosporangiaceae bacterium]